MGSSGSKKSTSPQTTVNGLAQQVQQNRKEAQTVLDNNNICSQDSSKIIAGLESGQYTEIYLKQCIDLAIKAADYEKLQKLLEFNIILNSMFYDSANNPMTPLISAILTSKDILEYCDKTAESFNDCLKAQQEYNEKIIFRLLPNSTAEINKSDKAAVNVGVNINAYSKFFTSYKSSFPEDFFMPIHAAIYALNEPVFSKLVELGANLKSQTSYISKKNRSFFKPKSEFQTILDMIQTYKEILTNEQNVLIKQQKNERAKFNIVNHYEAKTKILSSMLSCYNLNMESLDHTTRQKCTPSADPYQALHMPSAPPLVLVDGKKKKYLKYRNKYFQLKNEFTDIL